ncbi:hypothetical protein PCE1_000044 [Barthelona sp. PCE]
MSAKHPADRLEEELGDRYKIIEDFVRKRGVAHGQIASFNYFINHEIFKIFEQNNLITSNSHKQLKIRYSNLTIGSPTDPTTEGASIKAISPQQCRLRSLTYSSEVKCTVQAEIPTASGIQTISEKNVTLGRIPIMLGSSHCVLTSKSPEELAHPTIAECPHDVGGYFVVRGAERVLLMQEQMSKNRVIVEIDSKGQYVALVQSSTVVRRNRTDVFQAPSGRIFVKNNSFTDDIPLFIVFKAFGLVSDMEIVQLICGYDTAQFETLLQPACHEAIAFNVRTRQDALAWIGSKIRKRSKATMNFTSVIEEGREALFSILLSHVPCDGYDFRRKTLYLAILVRRLLTAINDPAFIDDKDYYGNKRIDMAGSMISLLFEDGLKTLNSNVRRSFEKIINKKSSIANLTLSEFISSRTITQSCVTSFATGNWNLPRFRMERASVTSPIDRLSYIATNGHTTRITSSFEKTRKVAGPRAIQPSQWGVVCISDTPEGEACGLVKNLALMAEITVDEDDSVVSQLLYDLGVIDAVFLGGEIIHSHTLVLLNGTVMGVHRDPLALCMQIRKLRKQGRLSRFLSIYHNSRHKTVYIATDGGRLVRPLLIVEREVPLLQPEHIKSIESGLLSFQDLFHMGVIEYLDVNEQNDTFIALTPKEITPYTTHLEIDPFTLLGVCAALVPYPHHNQSPRNTYQCAMGKQAMGAIADNQLNRFDTILFLLVYPQRPMVASLPLEMTNYNKLPAGQNAIVAVMSYSGYDIEDALILSRGSIDRGYARCMVLRREVVKFEDENKSAVDKLPQMDGNRSEFLSNSDPSFANIDFDGLAMTGSRLKKGDIYVRKIVEVESDTKDINVVEQNARYKAPTPAMVDRMVIAKTERDAIIVKTTHRRVRRPELGDKFSSRHGQKGVTGLIVPQESMPFSESGINPDVIMNPHGYPSRMTVGKLLEMIAGKAGLFHGKYGYGTCFGGTKVNDIAEDLVTAGYSYGGKDLLFSGITGEMLEAYIFFGPIYYQRLKHLAVLKMHARGRGPVASLTRQATEGRSRDGGLRLGEMERDCLVGYGAGMLMRERLLISADQYDANVCQKCGILSDAGYCRSCRTSKHVTEVKMPYACKLLFQELQSMNVVPKLKLKV